MKATNYYSTQTSQQKNQLTLLFKIMQSLKCNKNSHSLLLGLVMYRRRSTLRLKLVCRSKFKFFVKIRQFDNNCSNRHADVTSYMLDVISYLALLAFSLNIGKIQFLERLNHNRLLLLSSLERYHY